jgi:prepilin-type N-terminal cleavage/methylation domain-containing protein
MRARAHQAGFTLIELLAVVAVLAMVLFFAVPSLDNISPGARLRATARKLGSTIELAQGEAASSGKEFVLAYDLNRGAYWVVLPPPDTTTGTGTGTGTGVRTGTGTGTGTGSGSGSGTDTDQPQDDAEHGLPPADLSAPGTSGPTTTSSTGTRTTTPTSSTTGTSGFRPATGTQTPIEQQPVDYTKRDTLPEELVPDDVQIQQVLPMNGKATTYGVVYVPLSSLGDEGSHIVVVGLKNQNGGTNAAAAPIYVRWNSLTRVVDYSTDNLGWQTISGN